MADAPSAHGQTVRISATADLHFGRHPAETYFPILTMASADADVLAICGDLTDHGRVDEAEALAKVLTQTVRIPIVAVLGNHDYESAQEGRVREILAGAGVHMLDGDAVEILGVGFAGVKGFCGGFGPRALGPWGEKLIKDFVQETVAETLKLETALARLRSVARVALLHYAPVVSTIEGEPPEIYPFLGSTRLEEPLVRYEVSAVFHGHAHHGQPEGRTSNGAPVFNVSLPLMQRTRPEQPFGRFDLALTQPSQKSEDRNQKEVRS
jgi:Icc-related predicted phosphoesterase